jgi:hypothetical protein
LIKNRRHAREARRQSVFSCDKSKIVEADKLIMRSVEKHFGKKHLHRHALLQATKGAQAFE